MKKEKAQNLIESFIGYYDPEDLEDKIKCINLGAEFNCVEFGKWLSENNWCADQLPDGTIGFSQLSEPENMKWKFVNFKTVDELYKMFLIY